MKPHTRRICGNAVGVSVEQSVHLITADLLRQSIQGRPACEPEPENACEASGADFAKGEELCGQLDPACQETSYDDCLADYCLL